MVHLVLVIHFVLVLLVQIAAVSNNLPPAAKVLAIVLLVYPTIQALKQWPFLAPYLTGWKAILLNVLLSAGGLLITVPADQLYTMATLYSLLQAVAGAAGIHGTVSALMSQKSGNCPACGNPLNPPPPGQ